MKWILLLVLAFTPIALPAQAAPPAPIARTVPIPVGAKLFLADMNGFEGDLRPALEGISSIEIVPAQTEAQFIVTGWMKLEARHRGVFYVDTAPPAIASMTIKPVSGGDEVFHQQVKVKFAGDGGRDAAKALARKLSETMKADQH